ncbi:MAG: 4Fe-4S binding protein [Desulfomonile tiedjei]|uniref:Indolepyruvate oxidoreductase subunit IorA n=1 Tax=Desulfomonile tiedjei TaxID=2358 RepID=A0A9D6V1B4_9BACT|nr:4Fe-4S binding protein [Desulfomonile tiedjei]
MTKEHDSDVRFLMGNEAIGRGIIEAGCSVAAAYPGTPSSEVLESLVRWKKELVHPIYLEWSVNEKVAFEVAYGASLAGARAVAAMKMVGLNVASDPFMSAAYLGVRGGLVVVVADDPGPHSSQTEQDSRFFGWFAKVPVLDPGTPAEALEMTIRAFELSEKYQVPVMLRPCLRVCHARQNITFGVPLPVADVGPFKRNWTRWAAIPRYRLVLHGELNEKLKAMSKDEPQAKPVLMSGTPTASMALITSGSVSSHVKDVVASDDRLADIAVYKVDMPFPVNVEALQDIVDSHDKTLLIEETYPVLELHIPDRRKVVGRLSGDVPSQGELTPEVVEDIIVAAAGKESISRQAPSVKPRRPSLCPGCPHRPAFYMIRQVFDKAVYAGDIGCYTLGTNMGAVDTCLCMGASIGMAGGLIRAPHETADSRVVATIGDSTFYHAGVPALINAVHTRASFVLVIMDNNLAAMTGGQPTPAMDTLADGSRATPISLERVVHGCGVDFMEVVDPYDYTGMREVLEKANTYTFEENKGVSVVIARRPCVRASQAERTSLRYEVGEECDLCMSCITDLECPAFRFVKDPKAMVIDEDQCSGCGYCVNTCPSKAVRLKGV